MGTVSKRLLGREEQYLVIMKLLLLSLLGCVAVQSAHHEEMKQIMKEIHTYNLRSQCWGEENVLAYDIAVLGATEKCMQLAPAYDLVELLKPPNNPFSTLIRMTSLSSLKILENSRKALPQRWETLLVSSLR